MAEPLPCLAASTQGAAPRCKLQKLCPALHKDSMSSKTLHSNLDCKVCRFTKVQMEAVAAFSLASNVIQFVDFSCSLFSTVHQVRNSTTGRSEALDNAVTVAASLKELCTRLTASIQQNSTIAEDRHTAALGGQCLEIAEDLLHAVARLQVKQGSSRRWKSFQVALKAVWKQDKIDHMMRQLNDLRMELILRRQFSTRTETQLAGAMKAVLDEGLKQLRHDVSELRSQQQAVLNSCATISPATTPAEQTIGEATLLSAAADEERYLLDLSKLVKSLYFDGIGYRYSRVSEAHPNTYSWAFDHQFASFLKCEETLFWVSGKPGSGKSTFMKSLLGNPHTTQLLNEWSCGRTVIACNYFFWVNSGSLARSQEGLLRSIVLDVLLQCPPSRGAALEFVRDLDPVRWQIGDAAILSSTWDLSSLSRFVTLLLNGSGSSCFAFFIDGLDEYDGRPHDLITLLHKFRELDNVKLCIASRPWNEFESAFGHNSRHKLYMQYLTYSDIETYAKETLEQNDEFQTMKAQGDDVGDLLVKEITNKAQGVFLWVRLVVQSLLRGLQNADRIIDLRRRVAEFPSDLDEFFRYIFDSLEPVYRSQIAKGFTLVQQAPRQLTAQHFWYLDHEEEEPEYALADFLPKIYGPQLLQELCKRDEARLLTVGTRIAGRFKGLLEVRLPKWWEEEDDLELPVVYHAEVDFMHRTVYDFLATKDCHNLISTWLPRGFGVYGSLCKAYLAILKDVWIFDACALYCPPLQGRSHSGMDRIASHVDNFLSARADQEAHTGERLEPLVKEFSRVVHEPLPTGHGPNSTYHEESLAQMLDDEELLEMLPELFVGPDAVTPEDEERPSTNDGPDH